MNLVDRNPSYWRKKYSPTLIFFHIDRRNSPDVSPDADFDSSIHAPKKSFMLPRRVSEIMKKQQCGFLISCVTSGREQILCCVCTSLGCYKSIIEYQLYYRIPCVFFCEVRAKRMRQAWEFSGNFLISGNFLLHFVDFQDVLKHICPSLCIFRKFP